ncbi:MAG: hypothetical protein HW387_14 [Parachlamydiales bacterium]|nr:hypothetical protein [Parachlamydiales bacterium]
MIQDKLVFIMILTALRKLIILSILVLLVMAAGRIWYISRDGFSVNRIHFPLSKESGGDEAKENEISPLLSAPYRYLGRGRQCYVFASADDRYVIKIPRFDRYTLPFFWRAMPDFCHSIKHSIWAGRQDRLRFTLQSFRIAAQDLPEETAVVYLHLHQTRSLPEHFEIRDRLNRSFDLNLNRTPFILQKKRSLMMPLVLKALSNNDRTVAQEMLSAFLDVIEARARKGIFNRDPSFLKNFGWDGSKSTQIDIGSFWRKSNLTPDAAYWLSLREGSARVQEWLAETDQEMLDYYNSQLEMRLNR